MQAMQNEGNAPHGQRRAGMESPAGPAAPTRRELLDRALELGAVVWAAGVAIPAAIYLWPAGSRGPTRRYVEVDPTTLPPGSARVLGEGGKPILLVHEKSGAFRALSAVCTHLGCIVHWSAEEGRILCPCHAGVFAADGSVVSGPPTRPLATYACRVVEGQLRVET